MEARTVIRGQRLKLGKVTLGPAEFMPEHVTTSKEEVIVCIQGKIEVQMPDGPSELGPGQFCYVPPETLHSVKNVSCGISQYFYTVADISQATTNGNARRIDSLRVLAINEEKA